MVPASIADGVFGCEPAYLRVVVAESKADKAVIEVIEATGEAEGKTSLWLGVQSNIPKGIILKVVDDCPGMCRQCTVRAYLVCPDAQF